MLYGLYKSSQVTWFQSTVDILPAEVRYGNSAFLDVLSIPLVRTLSYPLFICIALSSRAGLQFVLSPASTTETQKCWFYLQPMFLPTALPLSCCSKIPCHSFSPKRTFSRHSFQAGLLAMKVFSWSSLSVICFSYGAEDWVQGFYCWQVPRRWASSLVISHLEGPACF